MTSGTSKPIIELSAETSRSRTSFERLRATRLLVEPVSSLVYRLYTLIDGIGFLVITAKELNTTDVTTLGTAGTFSMIAKVVAALVVPGYLAWRNVATYRQHAPMLPRSLLANGPWHFKAAVMLVWVQVFVTLVAPFLTGWLGGGAAPAVNTLAYDLQKYWEAALWFGGPAIFLIELTMAREHSMRKQ